MSGLLTLSVWLPSAPAAPSLEAEAALLLARNCLECHNASDHKGGLDLTRRERALAGGDSGQVLKPGDLESQLLTRIESGEMPPKGRSTLSADDRKLLREWIKAGAKWAADPIDPFLYTSDRRAGYNWWSLQPLRVVEPPTLARQASGVASAPRLSGEKTRSSDGSVGGLTPTHSPNGSAIDNFVLQRLTKSGLKPSPEADRP